MKIELKDRIENLSQDERQLVMAKLYEMVEKNNTKLSSRKHNRMVAYIQPKDSFEEEKLKSYLKKRLPHYMVPSVFTQLDVMPILPNGKVDKKSLGELKASTKAKAVSEIKRPVTEIEKQLIEIWEEVLNFKPIGTNDNFFEIGGDSILSIQIISKARKLGMMLAPNQLFDHQTIAELTKHLSVNDNQEDNSDFLVVLRKKGKKKPLFCVHSGGGHVFFYNLLTEYMKSNRPIYALQPSGLFGEDTMHDSIEKMTADYIKAMRGVQPEGPYNVLVYCFSATVGNEMAIQLEKVGQKINIIVIDTMASPWALNTPVRVKARIGAFFIRFFKNPIKSIKLFFVDRFWRISPLWVKLFGNDEEKDLEKLKINLRKICLAYEWKDHMGNVSLVLTEKPNELLQKVTIDSWKKLAIGGVKTILTKGDHRTLFEEPDVQYVSEKIDECMVEQ